MGRRKARQFELRSEGSDSRCCVPAARVGVGSAVRRQYPRAWQWFHLVDRSNARGVGKGDRDSVGVPSPSRRLRIVRNWHIPEVDTVPYHQSDIALMAHAFDALVVNEWGKPEAMYDQIKEFL